ncbi:MAG: nucleoside-diphosphate sugar epimerase/dehydratase [Bacteroidales bacterium]|nr:nucleoside-diphosphate sugar epimerase/dehydratase [Bacteroidales bacterium]MDY0370333.1 nucleoside-diphosphate sugar epimerase/dehydratase [Bacteroidales bacterium]
MLHKLYSRFSNRFLSRWIVFLFDLVVVYLMFIMANLISINFDFVNNSLSLLKTQYPVILLVYAIAFYSAKTYAGIIRQTGTVEVFRIVAASTASFLILLFIYFAFYSISKSQQFIPSLSVLITHFLLVSFSLITSRYIIKSTYEYLTRGERKDSTHVLIYGAGSAGMLTRNALYQDVHIRYDIVAFLDDNTTKINKRLKGIPILSRSKALTPEFVKKHQISQLIITIQKLDPVFRREVVESGLELGLQVKTVPAIEKWIDGQLRSAQLRQIQIEELLEREPIRLDNSAVTKEVKDKVIMVTGAAGSIGSEIVRQLLHYKPARVVMVDQAESALFDLQTEIRTEKTYAHAQDSAVFLVANIKDSFRMDQIFNRYKPHIVYHAAAYKHVPLMEENPYEAVLINVFGSKTIADLAVRYQVKKFVMVSTDKAVNPTNVMGASKRIAEIYTQSLNNAVTQFVTTRFGNVLGSNGSVIPLFKKQIERGGPITITHKDIYRYFMTIPEACNLVLEAGAMGNGGEIFVFDMGQPVRIFDLAHKMIQLSGLIPEKDIRIEEVGLRPGEKLYEELLTEGENPIHTHHPKIMCAQVESYEKSIVDKALNKLGAALIEKDDFLLVKKMKELVPEYRSNNSVYSTLDAKK